MTDYLISFARKYAANYKGLNKSCWQGIMLICINTFTIGTCFFLSLYFVNTLGFTVSTTGLLLSCYGVGTMTGGLFAGKLSDQFSPKFISIFSLLMQSVAFFLLIHLQSAFTLMPNLFLLGVAAYGFKTANYAWILNLCGEDTNLRYRTISISHIASNFGLGLSGIVIASMTGYGFYFIFYLSGFLLLGASIYLLMQSNMGSITPIQAKEEHYACQPSHSRILLFTLTCVFLVGLIIAQLGSTYPIFIQELFPALGLKAVSILFILDTFLIVFFQAPLTTFLSNQNKFLVTGFGALFMGIGMLVLVFSSIFTLAILSCIIWTVGEMLFISTAQLLCYESSNNKKKGQTLGVFQTVFATSNVIGPTLGGIIYQYGSSNLLWYCCTAVGLMCFLLCWHFSRTNTYTTS